MPLRGRSLQGTSLGCWGWMTELPLMAKAGYGDVAATKSLDHSEKRGSSGSDTVLPTGSI